jgi:hypothetical protein
LGIHPGRPEEKDQLQIWVQNNAIASGIIKGALSESQLGHVMGIESAKDVRDKTGDNPHNSLTE